MTKSKKLAKAAQASITATRVYWPFKNNRSTSYWHGCHQSW